MRNFKHINMKENKIIIGSRDVYKNTEEFKKEKESIKEDINLKFDSLIMKEKNVAKRHYLKIKRAVQIYKRIKEITSLKKLYYKVR